MGIAGEAARHASVTNRVDRELNLFVISAQLLTIDVFLSLVPLDRNRQLRDRLNNQQNYDFDKIRVILRPRNIGILLAL